MCRLIAGLQLMGACGGAEVPAGRQATGAAPMVARTAAATPGGITPESRRTMDNLAAIEVFALGGVGIVGSTSRGETLTLELTRQPDAVDAFTALADHGNGVTRLYAYWALRTLAPDRARAFAAALDTDRTMVETMTGCIGSYESVGAIARRMQDPRPLVARVMPPP